MLSGRIVLLVMNMCDVCDECLDSGRVDIGIRVGGTDNIIIIIISYMMI